MSTNGQRQVNIEPLISYPSEAQIGRSYIMTIDLHMAPNQDRWPYQEEEYVVWFILDTLPLFSHEPVGEGTSSVVLHRFGGTYGPAMFVLTAAKEEMSGEIRILLVNKYGIPIKQITLKSEIKIVTATQSKVDGTVTAKIQQLKRQQQEGKTTLASQAAFESVEAEMQELVSVSNQVTETETFQHRLPIKAQAGGVEFECFDPSALRAVPVLVQALDNQWLPRSLLNEAMKKGEVTRSIEQKLKKLVRTEYIRALINSQQVVLNRVYLYNNLAISQDFVHKGPPREAFKVLLDEAVIVPYLLSEMTPVDQPVFGDASKGFLEWREVCQEVRTKCLRLSWNHEQNQILIRKHLSERFQKFVLSAVVGDIDTYLQHLHLDLSAREGFRRRLEDLSRLCLDLNSQGTLVTRNDIYKAFISVGGNSAERKYDNTKPFAAEIKQLVDLAYNCNLPDALGGYLITPVDSLPRTALQEWGPLTYLPTIAGEDLVKLMQRTALDFFGSSLQVKSLDLISLQDVCEIRRMDEWTLYIQSMEELLRNPLNYADGGVSKVADSYIRLLGRITDHITKQDRRENVLTTWSPTFELIFDIGGALLTSVLTALGPIYSLSGKVTPTSGMKVPVVGRLVIRDSKKRSRQDLSTSIDFMRFMMPDAEKQWREIELQVRKLPGFQETTEISREEERSDPTLNYQSLEY